jgi:hypothetical protein
MSDETRLRDQAREAIESGKIPAVLPGTESTESLVLS